MIPIHRGAAALLVATVVNLPFGRLYTFGVFHKPKEALLGATRAEVGLVFGLATLALTVGTNVAPRLYRQLSPIALACGLNSGLGLVPIPGIVPTSQITPGAHHGLVLSHRQRLLHRHRRPG